ncbi:MAG: ATP-binding cassette domain-containing protein, partial [Desulfobacula sp.]
MTREAPVLEVKNLEVVRGGVPVLSIPSLSIAESEVFFLIGPNGAGKSTLLQTLAALVKPSKGEIRFRGKKVGEDISLLSYRRKIAMILQEPLLFNTTVYKNVASGLKIRGMSKKEIDPIVDQTLDRFGISHLRDRAARTLSGGEARRASIARAFATDPEVLFLDEPFSALDPIIREAMMEDLEKVLRETKITTLFVTHDRIEALRLAGRLGVMTDGRIIQTGNVGEIMNHPKNEIVASLVGVETILQGKVIESRDRSVIISISGKEIEAVGDIP